jgi:hypothetical protein
VRYERSVPKRRLAAPSRSSDEIGALCLIASWRRSSLVPTPILLFFLGVCKAQEPARVQRLRSEVTLKPRCGVGPLPGWRKVEYDAALTA